MNCVWCGRPLYEGHGYSETGEPICASYTATPNKAYNACKARKNRKAIKTGNGQEKTASEASSVLVERLTEALQVIITQNDELIALQRQQVSQPKQVVVREETNTIKVTKEFTAAPSVDDLDFDLEINLDKSTNAVDTLINRLNQTVGDGKRVQ